MNTAARFQELMQSGATSTDQALAFYDALEPAGIDFMLGKWKGAGVPTGHYMDGLLELFNWHGKEFVSADHVHPLVFVAPGGGLVKLNPRWMNMRYARNSALARHPLTGKTFGMLSHVLKTNASKARLRMIEFRGKISAAMLYDDLPINDVFRKIDDDTLLGIMDLKGMTQPFFFLLRREG